MSGAAAPASQARAVGIRAARRTTRELGALYGRMGSQAHPHGKLLVAYRAARRGVADAYRQPTAGLQREALADSLGALRLSLYGAAGQLLAEAYQLGSDQAGVELEARGLQPPTVPMAIHPDLAAWQKRWEAQLSWVELQFRNGADPGEIVGDRSRAGSLSAAPIIALGALLLTGAALGGWRARVAAARSPAPRYWWKQAVATIDRRTTNCCLGVHGQAQPLEKPFITKGEPHFAEKQLWAPFHFFCRTVAALLEESEAHDAATQALRAEAKAERQGRSAASS